MLNSNNDEIALNCIERAYIELLRMPVSILRIKNQSLLCALRDCIAENRSQSREEVQHEFEMQSNSDEVVK